MGVKVAEVSRFCNAVRSRTMLTLGVLGLGAVLVASCGQPSAGPGTGKSADPATGALASFYQQRLHWTDCQDGYDCATVKVPLDYENPSGKTIDLALARLKAPKAQGSLLIDPGGPGASGVDYVRMAPSIFTSKLIAAYDLVGFDPRGVARSAGVHCISDKEMDAFFAQDPTPDTAKEVAHFVSLASALGAGCAANSPGISAHMSTAEAARDMDIIRAALGDAKLNYLGVSYGTFLGTQYAEDFPSRVGRMVLDGVSPSSLTVEQIYKATAVASDDELRRFIVDCLPRYDCPLRGSVAQADARVKKFLADLDSHPIAAAPGRPLTEGLASWALPADLYDPQYGWPALREGLNAAFAGDGSMLVSQADALNQRNADGTYASNLMQAYFAVQCLDTPELGGPQLVAKLAPQWESVAPAFGATNAWLTIPCWHWKPHQTAAAAPPVMHAKGSGPILVVSNTHDPATPYVWGVEVAKELANARLLTYNADGHTAYHRGSTCIDDAVDAYFVEGTLPAAGTTCNPDG